MTTATADVEHDSEPDVQAAESSQTGASYDDINVPVVVMVGVISTIVTIVMIFFVQGLTYQWKNSFIRERSYDYVNTPVRNIVEGQQALLNGEQEGIKSIDDTMNEVVEKFGEK